MESVLAGWARMPAAFSLMGPIRTGRSLAARTRPAALTMARAEVEVGRVAAAAGEEADARAGVGLVVAEAASEAVEAGAAAAAVVAEVEDAATTRTRDPATRFNSHHRLRMYSIT